MNFRHEWKHELNISDMLILRQRLRAVATPDPHAIDGKYEIHSLYFDNMADKALREKLDGVNMREKFRIRFYNENTDVIYIEKKSKFNGLGTKQSVPLTRHETAELLNGRWEWLEKSSRPLAHELRCKMINQGLRPKTIVDYIREPFIYIPGNVRVTLDYDIRTGIGVENFLEHDRVTIPTNSSFAILEVKWDEFLPSIIRDIVQLEGRRTSSFSKYAACRVYG